MRQYAVTLAGTGELPASGNILSALTHAGAESPSASRSLDRFGASFFVSAEDELGAFARAREIVFTVAPKLNLVEAVIRTPGELDRRLAESNFPDLVGVSEVAEIIGVSKQRAWQLKDRRGFPPPVVELKSGPLWLRATIESWLTQWPRRPGRPLRSDIAGEALEGPAPASDQWLMRLIASDGNARNNIERDKGITESIIQEPRRLSDFDLEILDLDAKRDSAINAIVSVAPQLRLMAYQADWHLRGLVYHLGRIRDLYEIVAQEVVDRAAGDQAANVIVMYSPAMQDLMFEFYAFISLARITLDQLQRFAGPAFNVKPNQLPSSITEMIKISTTFPLYNALATSHRPVLQYLLDIRDCIVHHRTFATPDNTVAVEEGFPEGKIPSLDPLWFRPIVRTLFRRDTNVPKKIVVNISLPDSIYSYDSKGNRGPMLASFTYDQVNLLTQSREFARLCTWAVVSALATVAAGEKHEFHKSSKLSAGDHR